jgi:hypothetical protein
VADKLMTITTDSAELLRAIDRLPAVVQAKCKARAHVTAQRIAREARARVRRRTGRLAGSIEVREDYARVGYVVGTFLQPKVGIALHRRRSNSARRTCRRGRFCSIRRGSRRPGTNAGFMRRSAKRSPTAGSAASRRF